MITLLKLAYFPQGPCIMYLHANTRCRLAVLEYLGHLLSAGFSVFAFDFSGCGLSEGNHVGNGLKEKEDVDAAVALLKENPQITGMYV